MSRASTALLGVGVGIVLGSVVSGFVVTTFDLEKSGPDAFGRNEIASNGAIQGELYPGAPELESRLVQLEDERLVYVRTVASIARWGDVSTDGPYRMSTGSTFTLVLTARAAPYTIADILDLAPETFVELEDKSYLLTESIAVLEGATLSFSSDTDQTIRLASDSSRFVSIVSFGGALMFAGSETSTVAIESWDNELGATDVRTDDGRAYVRAIGGQATFSSASFTDLGFWSGNTGGLALTGSDAVGSFDATDSASLVDDSIPEVAGALLLPAGALADELSASVPSPFVSASIDNVQISGNAFGLFVSSAVNVVVRDSEISNSLVDGLVFHRFVTDSSVADTTSSNNAVDGITLGRSTTGVLLSRVESSANGRNGISIDGQPLADGPSAVGTEVESYGDNTVEDSVVDDNGRYGIEVSGGRNLTMTDNDLAANQVGVVLNHGTSGALITGNSFDANELQSVAVRDGVLGARVSDNTFTGGDTAIYVRNAEATITGNEISSMSNHGVTIIGEASSITVGNNSIAGYGTLPIYDREAIGLTLGLNDVEGWHPAATPASVIRSIFQPLTIIWLALALMLLITAVGPRSLRFGSFRHPYAEQIPLQSLSKGVVARHALNRASE